MIVDRPTTKWLWEKFSEMKESLTTTKNYLYIPYDYFEWFFQILEIQTMMMMMMMIDLFITIMNLFFLTFLKRLCNGCCVCVCEISIEIVINKWRIFLFWLNRVVVVEVYFVIFSVTFEDSNPKQKSNPQVKILFFFLEE